MHIYTHMCTYVLCDMYVICVSRVYMYICDICIIYVCTYICNDICAYIINNKGRIGEGRNREEGTAILPEMLAHLY